MGRPYSEDLRSRIDAAVDAGATRSAAAEQFSVSVSCAVKLMQRFQQTGSVAPAPRGRKPFALAEHGGLVRKLIAEQPDAALDELTYEIESRGIRASRSAVNRVLKACGLTLKKKSLRAAEQERPDVAAAREVWRERQPSLDPDRLVFIDETWATTNMTRRYGRAARGQRLVAPVPHGHWKTSTFVAGLRRRRVCSTQTESALATWSSRPRPWSHATFCARGDLRSRSGLAPPAGP
jgi:transposase